VVIAQCTGSKRDEPAAARELYDESAYFRRQREYAEARGDVWFIQSAKHGLLGPDERIEPYDKHAKNVEDAEEWAEQIAADLSERVPEAAVVELLGGKDYADPLTPALERRGFDVVEPLRGLGIGKRRSRLKQKTQEVSHASLHG
jgi:hypothetical protein